jgi:hypothetical protein
VRELIRRVVQRAKRREPLVNDGIRQRLWMQLLVDVGAHAHGGDALHVTGARTKTQPVEDMRGDELVGVVDGARQRHGVRLSRTGTARCR